MIISILTEKHGASEKQIAAFKRLISKYSTVNDSFQHGGEKGDIPFHQIITSVGFKVKVFPSNGNNPDPAFNGSEYMSPNLASKRNISLVETAEALISLPQYMSIYENSPMWMTTRNAMMDSIEVLLITKEGHCFRYERL